MDNAQHKAEEVTAVITTFNRPGPLKRAMESVASQTMLPHELIVIDNGNQEGTREVVDSFRETSRLPVRLLLEEKRGVSAARNKGIKETVTSYVAFLDDDDSWAANHIELFLRHVDEFPNMAIHAGWTARLVDPEHRPLSIKPELLKEYREKTENALRTR